MSEALRLSPLGWTHLELLQVRVKVRLCSPHFRRVIPKRSIYPFKLAHLLQISHLRSVVIPARHPLSRVHLILLEIRRVDAHVVKLARLVLLGRLELIAEVTGLVLIVQRPVCNLLSNVRRFPGLSGNLHPTNALIR